MKARKLSAILLAGALMATPVVTAMASAKEPQTAVENENGNIVDPSGNLVIRGTIVTEVTEQGKNASEIIIPEGVTYIEQGAFYGCTNLTSVIIPDSVGTIAMEAFKGCSSLTNITIPEGVNFLGHSIFDGTLWLENNRKENPCVVVNGILIDGKACTGDVIIPDGLTEINDHAFEDCENITSVTIPYGINEIGSYAFRNCTGLKEITIPNSVTSISIYAFEGCTNLASITIPDSVEKIEANAFAKTAWMENKQKESPFVVVNDMLIDGRTCTGDVVIPDGVKIINNFAFYDCKNITSVTIPDGVTEIRDGAFVKCISLANVIIPKSVTKIAYDVFSECKSLTSVTLPNSLKEISSYTFQLCTGLTSITIPKGVKEIGGDAFWGCESLESVIIPDSVKYLNSDAFKFCDKLKDVYYTGSEEQWNKIRKSYEFDENVTIHYNSDFPTVEYSDETTGIVALAEEGEFDKGTELTVKAVSDKTDANSSTYDISFVKDGKEVEPYGEVTVKLPVPEALKGKTLYVYRAEADGTYTNMNAAIDGDYIVFTTDHFSEYVVTTDGTLDQTTDSSDNEPSYDDTDTSSDDDTSDSTDNTAASSDNDTDTSSDNTSNNGADKENVKTGFGGVVMTLGMVALAGATVVAARKRK